MKKKNTLPTEKATTFKPKQPILQFDFDNFQYEISGNYFVMDNGVYFVNQKRVSISRYDLLQRLIDHDIVDASYLQNFIEYYAGK